MGRKGQVWKDQGQLTSLGIINEGIGLVDQIKVRKALQLIRKANVKGSQSEQDRQKMRDLSIQYQKTAVKKSKSDKLKRQAKVMHKDDVTGGLEEHSVNVPENMEIYQDVIPLHMRTMDEIIKDARVNHGIYKDRKKMLDRVSKFGQLRPICTELIEELKNEELKRKLEKLEKQKTLLLVSNEDEEFKPSNLLKNSVSVSTTETGDSEEIAEDDSDEGGDFENKLESYENVETENGETMRRRPHSAGAIRVHRTAKVFDKDLILFRIEEDASASQNSQIIPVSQFSPNTKSRPRSASALRTSKSSDSFPSSSNSSQSPLVYKLPNYDIMKRRTSAVIMKRGSVIDEDFNIQKALKKKNDQLQEKEETLLKKLMYREHIQQEKVALEILRERQKAWLSVVVLYSRLRFFCKLLQDKRNETDFFQSHNISKRAIGCIKRWWSRMVIKIKMRRHPWIIEVFRKYFLRHFIRIRLKKKRQAVAILLRFLRDSTGLSEYVSKIYAFRQAVIRVQKYIRGWIDAQQYRIRLLWMACERYSKVLVKQDFVQKLRNEKSSLKAISRLEGFSETVVEINQVKKRIHQVLEHQEIARKQREELTETISKIKDYRPQSAPLSSTSGSIKFRRRKGLPESPSMHPHHPGGSGFYGAPSVQSASFDEYQFPYLTPQQSNSTPYDRKNSQQTLLMSSHGGGPFPATTMNHNSSMYSTGGNRLFQNTSGHRTGSMANILTSAHATASMVTGTQGIRRRIGRVNDLGVNSFLLGVSERNAHDAGMQLWYKKIRTTPYGLKLYEGLRWIVYQQRKRHLLAIETQCSRRKATAVEMDELKEFLRDPKDFSRAQTISEIIGNMDLKGNILSEMRSSPFLLLTKGGLEMIEMFLKNNRSIRILS